MERIAQMAALRLDAVLRQPATFGQGLPKAAAQIAGQHVHLDLAIAVRWGPSLTRTAADVRSVVAGRVAELTGLVVDGVAVDIVSVEYAPAVPVPPSAPASAGETGLDSSPAKRPVATPAVATVGVLIALLVVAAGIAGIRDTLQAANIVTGPSWTGWLADKLEVLIPADWMIPAGILAMIVGLWFLVAALKPRRATHVPLGQNGVWIRRRDLARVAVEAASNVDSVRSASAKSKRKTLRVTARATGDTTRVGTELETSIARRLAPLSPVPRIRSRIIEEH